ncbi:MAG: YceI family protein [Thermodesulfobacteriota bacterium]
MTASCPRIVTGLAFACALALAPQRARAESCTYSVDPSAIGVTWTAFKFTDKTAVKGRFNATKVSGPTSAPSLQALAKGLSMDIDGMSVETDNPARNATISQFFFGVFQPAGKIQASVADVKGDEAKGTIDMKITMNGVTRVVPFAYTATPAGEVEAKGSFDMMDFQLGNAHESIHRTCEEQHKGTDGVSKTWTDVGVTVKGRFAANCA